MSINSLLLSRPIPVESMQLGRLVLDPKYPDQDFIQPCLNEAAETNSPEQSPGRSRNRDSSSFAPDIATQRFQNFSEIIEHARGTRLELSLLNLLSFAASKSPHTTSTSITNISSSVCIIRQLRNTSDYFTAICRQPPVRDWLQRESTKFSPNVYLVCGFRSLVDARVEQASNHNTELSMSTAIPGSLIVAAAGVPIVIPALDLDLGAGLSTYSTSKEAAKYTATGEQVFAVQYRKVRFSRFSAKRVDKACLERGNRWHSLVQSRPGETGDDIDVVEAELEEMLPLTDLLGEYESFTLDDEEMFVRIDSN
ncbi:hypothetical protein GGS26DRAFT_51738 [Hypomontagnella submonticulosa]|nr:hypothetical protein GGS26DRAFT_51738 [Hypomontagnella submonticulosa]